jgi:hypothetical protein
MVAKREAGDGLLEEWKAAQLAEQQACDDLADVFDTYCLGEQAVDEVVEAIHHRVSAAERTRHLLERLRKRGRDRLKE